MKIVYCFLFICLPIFIFAQKKKIAWSQTYDYQWHPTDNPASLRYYTEVEKTDSGFVRRDYFLKEKSLEMIGLYEDDSCKIANGLFTHYYPSGKAKSQGKFLHGKRQGLWVEVYESGKWKDSTVFENGRPMGISMGFYENGNLKDSIVHEPFGLVTAVNWFENGNVSSAGKYERGNIPIRTWLYYHANGQLASKEKYEHGHLMDKEYYDENGSAMDTTNRDRPADFPGGNKAWKKYLYKNLYFPSQYKIVNSDSAFTIVQWEVGVDGYPSNIQIILPFSKEFDRIVVNAIKNCKTKWIPAIEHNRAVIYRERQKVTFNQNVN